VIRYDLIRPLGRGDFFKYYWWEPRFAWKGRSGNWPSLRSVLEGPLLASRGRYVVGIGLRFARQWEEPLLASLGRYVVGIGLRFARQWEEPVLASGAPRFARKVCSGNWPSLRSAMGGTFARFASTSLRSEVT